ncbi:MAG: hypothetical protein IPF92_17895 [Myxococcales bacterium]|nr:hypothetical protein [Myxococcales bacterium]MBL0196126.1 hypothetical protein [Myxococcales bacterium]
MSLGLSSTARADDGPSTAPATAPAATPSGAPAAPPAASPAAAPPAAPPAAAAASADAEPAKKAGPPEGEAPKPPPAPYSLPWGMRPAVLPNVVRLDSNLAFQDKATTIATVLTGGYQVGHGVGVLIRIPYVYNAPQATGQSHSLANPLLGTIYSPKIAKDLRLGLFAGVTLPIGMGGGNDGSALSRQAAGSGIYGRAGLDNALFAVNYMTPTIGVGFGYVAHGLTAQAEATLLQLIRVRGDKFDKDDLRTNSTMGLHVGYAVLPWLLPSVELRYQHWLSTPTAVAANDALRQQLTAAIGVRGTVKLTKGVLFRPGVAYSHPVDDPMAKAGYRTVTLDFPFLFQ